MVRLLLFIVVIYSCKYINCPLLSRWLLLLLLLLLLFIALFISTNWCLSRYERGNLWEIYHRNPIPVVKVFRDGVFLTNSSAPVDEEEQYRFVRDQTICFPTVNGEETDVYTLLLLDPTVSLQGEYEVEVDSFSGTITLGIIVIQDIS